MIFPKSSRRIVSALLTSYLFFLFLSVSVVQAASLTAQVIVSVLPNAPSNLTASASSQSQINLSWTDNSNNEDGFKIERSTPSDTSFSQIATTSANIATYSDTGLSANTTYFYRVRAFNSDGNSSYSNEASSTTQSAPTPTPTPSGGGGGGGGGGGAPVFITSAIFRGIAYPSSNVTLLQNAQVMAVTKAGPDAVFEIDLNNISAGIYNYGVWAEDADGRRSITQTFLITVTSGATTVISGIFLPPSIGVDKTEVRRGDILNILGYTAPRASVSVIINSDQEIVKNTTSSAVGFYLYKFNSGEIDYGGHTTHSRAATLDGNLTTDSSFVSFKVSNRNVFAKAPQKCAPVGDLNADCRVNLVDFSIMAYWYRRASPPANVDLDGDGKVDIVDFSILAYYWTG